MSEEEILSFWKDNHIFEKSLKKPSPKGDFVFYEGPPTANGRPGIHHLEARAFKDLIPRYKTMRGYRVLRKGGWDTHGLPVELEVEKELGLSSKKEIEKYGLAKFNAKCKESVLKYKEEWEQFTDRIGHWLDLENPYITYDPKFMETVWHIISSVDKKGLLYKDYKVLPWCPRCGTALSSHELAQGYQVVKDLSVTAKFEIVHEPGTYLLAWTTTPWTLPGNVALAVGENIVYQILRIKNEDGTTENVITAKDLGEKVLTGKKYEIIKEIKGSELIGKEYKPLYPYIKNLNKEENIKNAYKVYGADFVTTEEGTGIVHTAVMYGQDDFELGKKVNLPKFHLVSETGLFINGTDFLTNRFVRDESVAVDIIKDLAHRGLLFSKEKYEHSYPHCWRCKTPMIYYARDSWYIAMSKLKDYMVRENEKIHWEPSHIKEGRFGEWLKDIKDWAVSRERYWGTPLPVWESTSGKYITIGSIKELKSHTKCSGNKYFIMRHGESESNEKGILSTRKENIDHVTQKGKQQIIKAVDLLKKQEIDLIITSPFMRTKETAEIVRDMLNLPESALLFDERIIEISVGEFEGKPSEFWRKEYHNIHTPICFSVPPNGGESLKNVKDRVGEFLYDIENKYKGKNILIISHGTPLWMLSSIPFGYNPKETEAMFDNGFSYFKNAEIHDLPFIPIPHNDSFELDLHRPYIDEIILEKGNEIYKRTSEVMDVWLDSGSMPFAQHHFPFEQDKEFQPEKGLFKKQKGYPADFISEAIDQTRGWFYTLHAVGALMDTGHSFKNVICLGHILDAEGKKMSKSVGNVVNPWEMIEKYGADVLRMWMYTVNQPGESKNFDEKTVMETKKTFVLIQNVLNFYTMYAKETDGNFKDVTNVLDMWMLSRLNELTTLITSNLEEYKVLESARAIRDFVFDLSQWYIRRSRDRFKSTENDKVLSVTKHVLLTLSKLLAPFAPFSAEEVYKKIGGEKESVHLEDWPDENNVDKNILKNMELTRKIVTDALQMRQKAGIQVRQPLSILTIKENLEEGYRRLIQEEVNVKEVRVGDALLLDETITPELKQEGDFREFVRTIQNMRKEKNLNPDDSITLVVTKKEKSITDNFEKELKQFVGASDIIFGDNVSIIPN